MTAQVDERLTPSLYDRIMARESKNATLSRLLAPALSLMVMGVLTLAFLMPSQAIAAYGRMRNALVHVETVHMITYSVDSTGNRQRGDTWVAYGCLRREGLRGMRGIRGVNGRADFDSKLGLYTLFWDTGKGKYLMHGTDVNSVPSAAVVEDAERKADDFTVNALVESLGTASSASNVVSGWSLWQNRKVETILLEQSAENESGKAQRSFFFVDPDTSLPIHAVFSSKLNGAWHEYETVDYEFNIPLEEEMFTIDSLKQAFAMIQPEP
ncbi:MAG TPA: hypothetical protein VK934_02165 [Fimbriimonas sp.]|nr:hypothetical protein [Fimbriimonas sp.]